MQTFWMGLDMAGSREVSGCFLKLIRAKVIGLSLCAYSGSGQEELLALLVRKKSDELWIVDYI